LGNDSEIRISAFGVVANLFYEVSHGLAIAFWGGESFFLQLASGEKAAKSQAALRASCK
jgi:hypothetical protein